MSVRSDTVAALAAVLDPNERQALLWAASLGAGACDSPAPGADPVAAMNTGRTLRALLPTLRDAAADDGALAASVTRPLSSPDTDDATVVQDGAGGHYVQVCATHGDTLTQCRCSRPGKAVRKVPCPGARCPGYTRTVQNVPTPCSSCGTSIARCDARIRVGRTACCAECAVNSTHEDTPSGFAERERARATRVSATRRAATTDDKTVADRSISRGTLRPRGV